MSTVIERLREQSRLKQAEAWRRQDGGKDLCIGAALAEEAADLLEEGARLASQAAEAVEAMVAGNAKLRAENARLRDLVQTLVDNDPEELAADGGVRVLDVWRTDARRVLGDGK